MKWWICASCWRLATWQRHNQRLSRVFNDGGHKTVGRWHMVPSIQAWKCRKSTCCWKKNSEKTVGRGSTVGFGIAGGAFVLFGLKRTSKLAGKRFLLLNTPFKTKNLFRVQKGVRGGNKLPFFQNKVFGGHFEFFLCLKKVLIGEGGKEQSNPKTVSGGHLKSLPDGGKCPSFPFFILRLWSREQSQQLNIEIETLELSTAPTTLLDGKTPLICKCELAFTLSTIGAGGLLKCPAPSNLAETTSRSTFCWRQQVFQRRRNSAKSWWAGNKVEALARTVARKHLETWSRTVLSYKICSSMFTRPQAWEDCHPAFARATVATPAAWLSDTG